jgi:hypothetical protein
MSRLKAAGDSFISWGGSALGSLDAQVTKDPIPVKGRRAFCLSVLALFAHQTKSRTTPEALPKFYSALGAINAEVVRAAQTASLGPCNNVNDHTHKSSSPFSNQLHSLEETGFHPVWDKKIEKNSSLVLIYRSVESYRFICRKKTVGVNFRIRSERSLQLE